MRQGETNAKLIQMTMKEKNGASSTYHMLADLLRLIAPCDQRLSLHYETISSTKLESLHNKTSTRVLKETALSIILPNSEQEILCKSQLSRQ